MKKRVYLIFGMILICSILFYAAGSLQKNMYKKYGAGQSTDKKLQSQQEIDIKSTEKNGNEKTNINEANNNLITDSSTSKSLEVKNEGNQKEGDNKAVDKTSTNQNSTVTETNNNSLNSTGNSGDVQNNSKDSNKAVPNTTATEKPNLIIIDTINNKTIIEARVKYDGRVFYDILSEVLDNALINNKIKSYAISNIRYFNNSGTITKDAKWRGSYGYVSDIDGLLEKKPISSSGWLYFRNGEKVPFGIGDQATKSFDVNDVITVKFYRDALNEK